MSTAGLLGVLLYCEFQTFLLFVCVIHIADLWVIFKCFLLTFSLNIFQRFSSLWWKSLTLSIIRSLLYFPKSQIKRSQTNLFLTVSSRKQYSSLKSVINVNNRWVPTYKINRYIKLNYPEVRTSWYRTPVTSRVVHFPLVIKCYGQTKIYLKFFTKLLKNSVLQTYWNNMTFT